MYKNDTIKICCWYLVALSSIVLLTGNINGAIYSMLFAIFIAIVGKD